MSDDMKDRLNDLIQRHIALIHELLNIKLQTSDFGHQT
jgi:hypothetical protein